MPTEHGSDLWTGPVECSQKQVAPHVQDDALRGDHESYQLRRAAPAPADLCKLHVVATLGHQTALLERISDVPTSWQHGGLQGPLLPPDLAAAAATAHSEALYGLRAAQMQSAVHQRGLELCRQALRQVGVVPEVAPTHGLERMHVRLPPACMPCLRLFCCQVGEGESKEARHYV
jgi:hypothetical protein